MRCAYDNQDEDTQRSALETLVAHTGKPEYWNNLLKISEHASGMRDHDTLDIYRLKLLTGTIGRGKETSTATMSSGAAGDAAWLPCRSAERAGKRPGGEGT